MRRSFFLLASLVLAAALVTTASCKQQADTARLTALSCERVYRVCPNVIPSSPTDATECADTFQGRCGAEIRQYVQCAVGKCDDAGAVDRAEAERACYATIEAFRKCEDTDGGGQRRDEGQLPPFAVDAGVMPDAS